MFTFFNHVLHYVPCMDVNCHQGPKSCSVLFGEFTSNKAYDNLQLKVPVEK